MKKRKIMGVIAILGALILAVFAIGPANAGKPVHWPGFTDFDWTYEGCEKDGAPVIIPGHLYESYEATLFFDKNGDPVSLLLLSRGTASLTYGGRTFTMHDVLNNTWTWPDPDQTFMTIRGIDWLGTVPGHGPIVGIAGRQYWLQTCPECDPITLKIFGMDFTDYEAMCNYLLYGE